MSAFVNTPYCDTYFRYSKAPVGWVGFFAMVISFLGYLTRPRPLERSHHFDSVR